MRYGKKEFWDAIPGDCKKAISELKRMKVYGCCAWDFEEDFSDVWWLVLHEVDMWVEGEFGVEAWHIDSSGGMNRAQAKRADDWLIRYLPLFNKYKKTKPGRFDDADFAYAGQVDAA